MKKKPTPEKAQPLFICKISKYSKDRLHVEIPSDILNRKPNTIVGFILGGKWEKIGLAWDGPDGIIGRRFGRRFESK
jgi:hypothetical protein